ncbi:MAG: Glu/Leu/Phe/Val dehydrogenase, partial [Candidatus Bipolaricaulia bacterium]
ERLTRRYAAEISIIIGPDIDIPAPDVYTSEREMAWLVDTISMHHNAEFMPGLVTGKPIVLGGSQGREAATARGGYFVALETLRHLGMDVSDARVVIQGYGNAGSHMAEFMHDGGTQVIAVSDSHGGIYNPKGLDPLRMKLHKQETGSVVGFDEAEEISNAELLELDCDLLIPAALENQLTQENVDRIRAKAVIEVANGPTTLEANEILDDRGVFVVPDILANAGGVTVSYLEWVQDRYRYFWSAERVDRRLRDHMTQAFRKTLETYEQEGVEMRLAAYMVAVGRVAEAARARGMYA